MTETWVLAPVDPVAQQINAADPRDGKVAVYTAMLAARPPIPRATWDAMVERGARATFLMRNGSKTCWAWDSSRLDDEHPGARERYLKDAETALRAALGQPQVEGDAP